MTTRHPPFVPLMLAALTLLAACSASTSVSAQEEILVLEVAPERAPCVGEMVTTCLQVRATNEEAWRLFYDPIDGFEHETGVSYTLEVMRTRIAKPPADGSSYRYRLLRIISRDPGVEP